MNSPSLNKRVCLVLSARDMQRKTKYCIGPTYSLLKDSIAERKMGQARLEEPRHLLKKTTWQRSLSTNYSARLTRPLGSSPDSSLTLRWLRSTHTAAAYKCILSCKTFSLAFSFSRVYLLDYPTSNNTTPIDWQALSKHFWQNYSFNIKNS